MIYEIEYMLKTCSIWFYLLLRLHWS